MLICPGRWRVRRRRTGRTREVAAYLLLFQHVSVERCVQLIADVTGARVSPGWVSSILAEAATLVAGSIKVIHVLLTFTHVRHVDETTTQTLLGLGERSREGANSQASCPSSAGFWCTTRCRSQRLPTRARGPCCGSRCAKGPTSHMEMLKTVRGVELRSTSCGIGKQEPWV
ncbi:transposase [Nonomuraea angiospora]|uniref:IS66 family transposase n=1 Tax=Nonomuraea angiospora TaxID=46172 RepID=UPI00332230BD